jgi:TolA-binding protein
MSDPRRLLGDPEASAFERDLVASWSEEQPSNAARARALAIAGGAVGVAAAGAAAATAAAATNAGAGTGAGAATAATAGALAPKSVALGVGAITKWFVVGLVVTGATVGTVVAVRPSSVPSTTTRVATSTATTTTPTAVATSATTATTATATAEPPTLSPADLPAATAAEPPPLHAPKSAAHDETLASQIALFDRARTALDGGDAEGALVLLDDYERRFPGGTFTQEAQVLRVQALLRKGNRAAATRAGERFLQAHPTSPHAARVRAMLNPSTP